MALTSGKNISASERPVFWNPWVYLSCCI